MLFITKKSYYIIIYIVLFTYLVILARLFFIITYKKDTIKAYSENQYFKNITIPTYRYTILDNTLTPIAHTRKTYALYFINDHPMSPQAKEYITKNFPESLSLILNNPQKRFFYLAHHQDDAVINALKILNIPDIGIHLEYHREYPYPFLTPIIGFVDIDLNGIAGLEFLYNDLLSYKSHKLLQTKSKFSLHNSADQGNAVNDIKTTLDASLSGYITNKLKDIVTQYESYYAVAIIMNGKNGDIVAYSQYPYYDYEIKKKEKNDIFFSKPLGITEAHEMGSIFKAFFALSALEEKIVESDELIDCHNTKARSFKHFTVNTWKAHGIIPFSQVIAESNNIGTAYVSQRMQKTLYDYYKKLGFGTKTAIELPGEAVGFVQPPSQWSLQTPISLSYGYEVSCSLLQAMRAWSIFINNGKIITPRILSATHNTISEQLFSFESIKKMRDILHYTEEKIPKKYRDICSDLTILGKTGTANILEHGEYQKNKNTYSFIGSVEGLREPFIIGIYIYLSNKSTIYSASITVPLFYEIIEKLCAKSLLTQGKYHEI